MTDEQKKRISDALRDEKALELFRAAKDANWSVLDVRCAFVAVMRLRLERDGDLEGAPEIGGALLSDTTDAMESGEFDEEFASIMEHL